MPDAEGTPPPSRPHLKNRSRCHRPPALGVVPHGRRILKERRHETAAYVVDSDRSPDDVGMCGRPLRLLPSRILRPTDSGGGAVARSGGSTLSATFGARSGCNGRRDRLRAVLQSGRWRASSSRKTAQCSKIPRPAPQRPISAGGVWQWVGLCRFECRFPRVNSSAALPRYIWRSTPSAGSASAAM
jgi:hypothetical protein